MQAKCFLADNFWSPGKVYHEAKGDFVAGFRDFEVTSDIGCGAGPAWTTVHPAAFHGPLKHFLDKNKIQ